MLTVDQLKPFLLHEDPHVRHAASEAIWESWPDDPELIPRHLDAWERYRHPRDTSNLYHCRRFPVTDAAFSRLLTLLAAADRESPEAHRFSEILANAPVELLAAKEAALLSNPHFDRGLVPGIERRRAMAERTTESLWEELLDLIRRYDDEATREEPDLDHVDDLIETLGQRDEPDAGLILSMLDAAKTTPSWELSFLIELAGVRRLREAVPALVEVLRDDELDFGEWIVEALPRIGGAEASRLLRAAYPDSAQSFRSYAADLLGELRNPESEDALLDLLEIETDRETRSMLCLGLCRLFSERGVEVVRREIEAGYEGWIARLEDELLPVAQVLGITLPEAERWTKERDEEQQRVARRIAEMESWAPDSDLDEGWSDEDWEPGLGLGPPAPEVEVTEPIRRTGPKVGRNDPCPCGSGKKFKKCCGRSA